MVPGKELSLAYAVTAAPGQRFAQAHCYGLINGDWPGIYQQTSQTLGELHLYLGLDQASEFIRHELGPLTPGGQARHQQERQHQQEPRQESRTPGEDPQEPGREELPEPQRKRRSGLVLKRLRARPAEAAKAVETELESAPAVAPPAPEPVVAQAPPAETQRATQQQRDAGELEEEHELEPDQEPDLGLGY
jgi:hypothetical protein